MVIDLVRMHPEAVVSHQSAARFWGLPLCGPPGTEEHVTVPPGCTPRPVPGLRAHRHLLLPDEVVISDGVAVTSPLRTVVDCARVLPVPQGVVIADAAAHLGMTSVSQLREAARSASGRGCARLRDVARLADRRAESAFESLVRVALLRARLGPAIPQYRLGGTGHRYDLALPWAQLLVECDGWQHHGSRLAFTTDRAFGNVPATFPRWGLVRLLWAQAWPSPEPLLAAVRAAVTGGRGPRVRQRRHRQSRS